LKKLKESDPVKAQVMEALIKKLYDLGVIDFPTAKEVSDVKPARFAKRRLPVILVRLKFVQKIKDAVTYIEQGHIRVGPEVVKDPAFMVTRNMEDYITWVDTSKIRQHILKYNDQLDDYDLLNT